LLTALAVVAIREGSTLCIECLYLWSPTVREGVRFESNRSTSESRAWFID